MGGQVQVLQPILRRYMKKYIWTFTDIWGILLDLRRYMRSFIWSPQKYEEFYLIFTEIWGTHLMKICTQTECYFDIILKRRTIIMIVSHCLTPFKVIFGGEGNAIQLIWQTLLSSSHFSSSALLILTINMMSRAKKWISTSFRETRFCRRLFFFFFFREVNSFPPLSVGSCSCLP